MKKGFSLKSNNRGVALLLVLWIVTLLAIICAEFSVTMRTEGVVARNFRESEQAYYAAEAGIHRAVLEMMRSARTGGRRTAAAPGEARAGNIAEDEQSDFEYWTAGGTYEFDVGEMKCRVEIEDESNKVNINDFLQEAKKNSEPLKKLLRKKLGLEGERTDIVADSLIDWRDADNNITGTAGAEDEYYKGLDRPYLCRNGEIPVVEELQLVRGIDEQLLFGRRGRPEQKIALSVEDLEDILSGRAAAEPPPVEIPEGDDDEAGIQYLGLTDIFSAQPSQSGTGAKVNAKGDITLNVNSATADQLLLLSGMTPATAAEIVRERKIKPFATKEDRLPSFQHYFRWKETITVSPQTGMGRKMLRINAQGCSPDGLVCRRITCTVLFSQMNFSFLSWREKT